MIAKLINPKKITNFNRTKADLELFAIFAVCVAGKKSQQTADKVNNHFRDTQTPTKQLTPFETIKSLVNIKVFGAYLQMAKIGQYKRIYRALRDLAESGIDLKTCSVEDLEAIHGIGPKTSRFIIMHSRPNQRLATLDTHILRWMRDQGINTPKATPQSKKLYKELEDKFLTLCDKRAILPSQLDLKIWKQYSK
jgi:thermostable 8-oxoguanine DNA glycosylase|tara:strand:+ start:280 stop:861 length:582 start_codon:yes stop_codon:yes gene_type:complete